MSRSYIVELSEANGQLLGELAQECRCTTGELVKAFVLDAMQGAVVNGDLQTWILPALRQHVGDEEDLAIVD